VVLHYPQIVHQSAGFCATCRVYGGAKIACMSVSKRIVELGLELPAPPAPVANYVPFKFSGGLLYLSGMIPVVGGVPLHTGLVGSGVSLEQAVACARVCVLNALGWASQALDGDLDRIAEVVRVRGFVACDAGFADHPAVANGASDLLVEIFGDHGRHTRSVVGCSSLPLNVPVEIDFLFSVGGST
jgi:enamine deaminase RidA (YjgF/YER057c/UK114 family)